MPNRTTIPEIPSDLPKIDLAGSYLEYMRLKEIVRMAEQRASHPPTGIHPKKPETANRPSRKPT